LSRCLASTLIAAGSSCIYSFADAGAPSQAILDELTTLKAMQSEITARIAALETEIHPDVQVRRVDPAPATSPLPASPNTHSKVDVFGDALIRYESNDAQDDRLRRDRGVLRARLGATYQAADNLKLSAMLETGDPDDPNSGYTTLSNFADDIQVSLSQAYGTYAIGPLEIQAGKIPNPFLKNDVLWDGDVYPAGISLIYDTPILSDRFSLRAAGLHFVIDETSGGPDSSMTGGQVALSYNGPDVWSAQLAAAYYDYDLSSSDGADLGDFRTNRLTPNGEYTSDFNLTDLLASVTYTGFGDAYPLTFSADYVLNSGAVNGDEDAFSLDANLGAAETWQIGYSYSEVETDAVLAAFSNDNYILATNYRTHDITGKYRLTNGVVLSASWFHYRPLDVDQSPFIVTDDWLDRVRLNASYAF